MQQPEKIGIHGLLKQKKIIPHYSSFQRISRITFIRLIIISCTYLEDRMVLVS